MRRIPHRSYPDDLPSFLGKGHPGNFEETGSDHVTGGGPGNMGHPHSLKVNALRDSEPRLDQMDRRVILNLCGVQLQVEQRSQEEKLKGVYGFNQLVSDEISLNRSVPELREEECKWWDYPTDMPTASVILVFHNEGWSTLLRTVNSVLNRCIKSIDRFHFRAHLSVT